jgi:hypothetical protein
MTSPLQKIVESKRALRRELASLPVAEKLRMLDAMREREVAIRSAAGPGESSTSPLLVQRRA